MKLGPITRKQSRVYEMKTLWLTHWQGILGTTIVWKNYGHCDVRCGGRFVASNMPHQATITGDAYVALFHDLKTRKINDA
jgi:hypothetical protein